MTVWEPKDAVALPNLSTPAAGYSGVFAHSVTTVRIADVSQLAPAGPGLG
jgi:hypothetical protein